MPPQLIGLTGEKGHGKDTVANIFRAHGYYTLSFAAPLKLMLRSFYENHALLKPAEIQRRLEGDLKEVPCPWLSGVTPRRAMQTLGTEWGRNCISENFWVDALLRLYKELRDPAVVSDVRFANEVEAIHRAGGVVYRVDSGGRVPRNALSGHVSEQVKTLKIDGIIDNSGTIERLHTKVEALFFAPGADPP